MNAKIFGMDGSAKGEASLPDELFAQPVHEHLLWLSVKRHEPFVEPARTVGVLRDGDSVGFRESKGATIEELVVERAEGEAIGLGARSAGLVPFDVCCFEGDMVPG